jgi:hypothetical protein
VISFHFIPDKREEDHRGHREKNTESTEGREDKRITEDTERREDKKSTERRS